MVDLALRYGTNPHQTPARACAERLPFRVVNGQPGAINLLDALNGWQLVRELRTATGLPAAASFKHVSPSGAALGLPLDETDKRACMVEDMDLTPLAAAYARARGGDRLCSYLDWAAASDPIDVATARLLAREACDGVVAPGYEDGAVAILRQKRGGRFCVLEVDASFEPPPVERRDVFGVTIEQPRNTVPITGSLLDRVVTSASIPPSTRRDLLLALGTAKYTQSNSVCLARDGQTIGVGAGQQSRVHCVRLAAEKARHWHLRRHPSAMSLPFRAGIRRPDRDNAIDAYVRGGLTERERSRWLTSFEREPDPLDADAKSEWLARMTGVALASDGLFPFRDNIDVATTAGVVSIAQPGGSTRDQDIVEACDEYGMSMAMTGLRLFHH
jgi:phosphoribosylaminoimidazolecarboxamide formyltransferase / IMP cyclohydrolase